MDKGPGRAFAVPRSRGLHLRLSRAQPSSSPGPCARERRFFLLVSFSFLLSSFPLVSRSDYCACFTHSTSPLANRHPLLPLGLEGRGGRGRGLGCSAPWSGAGGLGSRSARCSVVPAVAEKGSDATCRALRPPVTFFLALGARSGVRAAKT